MSLMTSAGWTRAAGCEALAKSKELTKNTSNKCEFRINTTLVVAPLTGHCQNCQLPPSVYMG